MMFVGYKKIFLFPESVNSLYCSVNTVSYEFRHIKESWRYVQRLSAEWIDDSVEKSKWIVVVRMIRF